MALIIGTNSSERLYSNPNASDIIEAKDGLDIIFDIGGGDQVYAGDGNDRLNVTNADGDILTGGPGSDSFNIDGGTGSVYISDLGLGEDALFTPFVTPNLEITARITLTENHATVPYWGEIDDVTFEVESGISVSFVDDPLGQSSVDQLTFSNGDESTTIQFALENISFSEAMGSVNFI
ncbi:MAG: hypothetical protein GVY17_01795 [Cyanobacteria bacterium]|jgi:hypothetical protein|nr:hypothetical protein [Cyanobacteria bacterium GSL.Bin21]